MNCLSATAVAITLSFVVAVCAPDFGDRSVAVHGAGAGSGSGSCSGGADASTADAGACQVECPGKDPNYNCPSTLDELLADTTRHWCESPSDSGSYDHVGRCFRQEVTQSGSGGQQCCYDTGSGIDNCTGTYDEVSPYVDTGTPGAGADNCSGADIDLACDHCKADVVEFCAENCTFNPVTGSFTNCGGDVDGPIDPNGTCDPQDIADADPPPWSTDSCSCHWADDIIGIFIDSCKDEAVDDIIDNSGCDQGDTRCSDDGNSIETCEFDGDGYNWNDGQMCPWADQHCDPATVTCVEDEHRGNGESCNSNQQCGSGACVNGCCFHPNEPPHGPGGACCSAGDCQQGMVCFVGTCQWPDDPYPVPPGGGNGSGYEYGY